jgi:GNAT superfamily N-acetyltransferase
MLKMKITTKELTPELWPVVEELFGANGACGGCWCMYWRIKEGEDWEKIKGPRAKTRIKKGVAAGDVKAVLAFRDGNPVGWCTFGPRLDFPRLARSRTLACDDAGRIWSIPCFFVKAGHRGQGVAGAMLEHALRIIKREGAPIAEGYPSRPGKDGKYIPSFSWTGTKSLFAKLGFKTAGNPGGGKERVRKTFK